MIADTDALVGELISSGAVSADDMADGKVHEILNKANEDFSHIVKTETDDLLAKVLYTTSMGMKNGFHLSDH